MITYDKVRRSIESIIIERRDEGTPYMPSSADLAGLTEDEWTADLIIRKLIELKIIDTTFR